ncbi:hypothetical protein LTR66_012093 [Elasticomyces elasticus]|nr:hypothetical protein LTR66_012093 [Elasticomyces elasticus]
MSNRTERNAEDLYERDNDASLVTKSFADESYANETNPDLKNHVPVQRDTQDYADPMQPPHSNSDQQLDEDEEEAINQSNVMKDRLRHAKPQAANKYSEGPDEDDLPAEAQ